MAFAAAVTTVSSLAVALAPPASAATTTFTRTETITIPGDVSVGGPASPYPSNLAVSGLAGVITDVNLVLDGFHHTFPDDIDVLLVSPSGQNLVAMSDLGGGTDAVDLTITIDDESPNVFPASTADGALASQSYQPRNVFSPQFIDEFPAPAPTPSAATALATFDGTDPNGTWSLYVIDEVGGNTGTLSGWSLVITTEVVTVPGQFQFSATDYLTSENETSVAVTVTRTNGSDGAASVTLTTGDGSATAGADYVDADQVLNFADGETSRVVQVGVVNDPDDEGINETIVLTLSAPTAGAAVGSPGTATVSIEDNDSLSNRTPMDLPAPGVIDGRSSYHPSRIHVQGLAGSISDVDVVIDGLSHDRPDDLDLLVVAPGGEDAMIMSDAGGGTAVFDLRLTFDDEAADPLPFDPPLATGTYRPTNHTTQFSDAVPGASPSGNTALSTFDGTDPNGTWLLYVVDNAGGNTGTLATGWTLVITTAPPVDPAAVTVTNTATPLERTEPGGTFTYSVEVTNVGTVPATITGLSDDVAGDLSALGTCTDAVATVLDPTENYSCAFDQNFTGSAGDTRTSTVTATVTNPAGEEQTGAGSATVSIVAAPGADVMVEVDSGGNLGVRGGVGDACLTVHRLDASTVAVTGCDSTTVNSMSSVVVPDATADLRIGDLGGNDRVEVTQEPGADWTGSILVDTGAGRDTVVVRGVAVVGNIAVGTGGGNDSVTIQSVDAGRSLFIETGAGSDQVVVDDSTVSGQTRISTSGGRDLVHLSGSSFEGRTQVDLGGGNDSLGPGDEAGGLCLSESAFSSEVALAGGLGTDAYAAEAATLPSGLGLADVTGGFEQEATDCTSLGS